MTTYLNDAFLIAQRQSPIWSIYPTASGGWQLVLAEGGGALINYMTNPCKANLGEEGKPYQAHCKSIRNFGTLRDALDYVANQKS